jgi:formate-dependent nitrite reductase cytochrome c552 subunit
MPFEQESAYHGRIKYESIKNSGANVVVVGCSNCHDQIMKRLPKFYTDYKYEVKYIWEVIADALVIEPWTDEEAARAQEEAAAQWERLGIDLDNMEY